MHFRGSSHLLSMAISLRPYHCRGPNINKHWYYTSKCIPERHSKAKHFIGVILQITIWFQVECCVSCIAACLPTLRNLLVKGSTTESLVSRFRSFFILSGRSRSTLRQSSKESGSGRVSDEAAKQQWYGLHNHTDSAVTHERHLGLQKDGITV